MIVFDLCCDQFHAFEGWFRSSSDFSDQKDRGILTCPVCGSEDVNKAPMAPSVPPKGNSLPVGKEASKDAAESFAKGDMPEEVAKAFRALAAAQAKALSKSEWVGDRFAEDARKMHYGEADERPIHGRASGEEAKSLVEEGIAVTPLVVPFTPPEEIN